MKKIKEGESIILGRNSDFQHWFNLNSRYISSKHVEITMLGWNLIIADLNSTNGTRIKKVEKSRHHEPEIVEEFHENKVEQEYDPYLDPTSTVNNTIAVDEYLYNNPDNSFDINY